MKNRYEEAINKSKSFEDVLEIVKKVVHKLSGLRKDNIDIYLEDLGCNHKGFTCAYYNYRENSITINSSPLNEINNNNKPLLNWYVFHVLLHEYIHSLGIVNERRTRELTYLVSKKAFGKNHILTQMAQNLSNFISVVPQQKNITYSDDFNFDSFDALFDDLIKDFENILDKFIFN